jgi:hypothetical protein
MTSDERAIRHLIVTWIAASHAGGDASMPVEASPISGMSSMSGYFEVGEAP